MSLYDRFVDIQVRLEAAQAADASDDQLARAARMVDGLDSVSEYLEGAAAFRAKADITDLPAIDQKAASQAVGAFRAGLSRHGSAGLQHQPASTLSEVAKSQGERASRWVTARWGAFFAVHKELMERVQNEHLVGSANHVAAAQARASKLRAARALDPVADSDRLRSLLGGEDVAAWLKVVSRLGEELLQVVQELDTERQALSPEVREALRRAASVEGFPLSEITAEILTALRAAGVDERLVVRRR